jgi:hypothetical protein
MSTKKPPFVDVVTVTGQNTNPPEDPIAALTKAINSGKGELESRVSQLESHYNSRREFVASARQLQRLMTFICCIFPLTLLFLLYFAYSSFQDKDTAASAVLIVIGFVGITGVASYLYTYIRIETLATDVADIKNQMRTPT